MVDADPSWRRHMVEKLGLDETLVGMVTAAANPKLPGDKELARLYASLYVAKQVSDAAGVIDGASGRLQVALQESTKKVIQSNEKLAKSTEKATNWLIGLTWVLVALTVVLVVLGVLPLLHR